MSIATEITRLQTAKADLKTAIEGKGVTVPSSAKLDDYADLVESISSGSSGISWDDIATQSQPAGEIVLTVNDIAQSAFQGRRSPSWRVRNDSAVTINTSAFRECTNLNRARFPILNNFNAGQTFLGSTAMALADLGNVNKITSSCFSGCTSFEILILRRTSSLTALENVNAFANTKFASGKTGGVIYIPKVFYDALGTGVNDYKSATNWSTVDDYGTITWAQLEGSPYEDPYGDW